MDSLAPALAAKLERFAEAAVAAGRYRDRAEVMAAGLALLQRAEDEAAAFVGSLEDARAEVERDGFLTAEQVEARARALIAGISRRDA